MAQPETLFNTASDISPHTTTAVEKETPGKRGLQWPDYQAKKEDCGEWAALLTCKSCTQHYNATLGCHMRTCPTCAKKYGDRIYREILAIAEKLPQTATHRLRLITLGYGTKKGMREGTKEAAKALTKLWRTDLRPRLNPGQRPAKYGKAGVFASIEFGAKNNSVHIHLLYWGPWVDQKKLSNRWKDLTGSFYADVRACKGSRGVREVVKYISKGITGNDYKAYEIEKALHGTRRIITYGEFYDRADKNLDEKYQFTCPCCGSADWEYSGTAQIDEFLIQEKEQFRRLRRASLGGAVAEVWAKNSPVAVGQPA